METVAACSSATSRKTVVAVLVISPEVIVHLIVNTITRQGLEIRAKLDTCRYPAGIKITDDEFARAQLAPHSFDGDWNHAIQLTPRKRPPEFIAGSNA